MRRLLLRCAIAACALAVSPAMTWLLASGAAQSGGLLAAATTTARPAPA